MPSKVGITTRTAADHPRSQLRGMTTKLGTAPPTSTPWPASRRPGRSARPELAPAPRPGEAMDPPTARTRLRTSRAGYPGRTPRPPQHRRTPWPRPAGQSRAHERRSSTRCRYESATSPVMPEARTSHRIKTRRSTPPGCAQSGSRSRTRHSPARSDPAALGVSRSVDLYDRHLPLAGLRRVVLNGSERSCLGHLFGFGAQRRTGAGFS
jgi:hypothetical protein